MININHLLQWAIRFVQGQVGSVASAEGEFTIPTKAGMMRFSVGGDVIYCRFENVKTASKLLGCDGRGPPDCTPGCAVNHTSGKWNHYFDPSCSAEKIAIDFEHAFLPVALHPEKLETVKADGWKRDEAEAELRALGFPKERAKPEEALSNLRDAISDLRAAATDLNYTEEEALALIEVEIAAVRRGG